MLPARSPSSESGGQSSHHDQEVPPSVESTKMIDDRQTTQPSSPPTSPPQEEAAANKNSNNHNNNTTSINKCTKCQKRVAREGCTQTSCLPCCTDLEGCETHRKQRAQALWKEQVRAGTTDVQRLAAAKRRMRMGRFFREPGFVYQGDTVVIWDLRAYASNPKWREEAVRKAMRRKKAEQNNGGGAAAVSSSTTSSSSGVRPRLRNSRKRFHRIVEERYRAATPKSG